ncbi:MAG: carbohydrate binding domain-containing protein [Pirellula sp.]
MKLLSLLISVALVLPVAAEKNLLKPANKADSWRLEQVEGGKAEMKVDEDSVTFKVTAIDSTDWHVQAVQTNLDLKDGTTYVLKFKARSPDEVTMSVNAMIDQEDWHTIGLWEEITLGKEYKEFTSEFDANSTVPKKNRISFVMGNYKGEIQIKDVSLRAK